MSVASLFAFLFPSRPAPIEPCVPQAPFDGCIPAGIIGL